MQSSIFKQLFNIICSEFQFIFWFSFAGALLLRPSRETQTPLWSTLPGLQKVTTKKMFV